MVAIGIPNFPLFSDRKPRARACIETIGRAPLKRHAPLVRGFFDRTSVVPWLAFPELLRCRKASMLLLPPFPILLPLYCPRAKSLLKYLVSLPRDRAD